LCSLSPPELLGDHLSFLATTSLSMNLAFGEMHISVPPISSNHLQIDAVRSRLSFAPYSSFLLSPLLAVVGRGQSKDGVGTQARDRLLNNTLCCLDDRFT
jgi:hypothetical protein